MLTTTTTVVFNWDDGMMAAVVNSKVGILRRWRVRRVLKQDWEAVTVKQPASTTATVSAVHAELLTSATESIVSDPVREIQHPLVSLLIYSQDLFYYVTFQATTDWCPVHCYNRQLIKIWWINGNALGSVSLHETRYELSHVITKSS